MLVYLLTTPSASTHPPLMARLESAWKNAMPVPSLSFNQQAFCNSCEKRLKGERDGEREGESEGEWRWGGG